MSELALKLIREAKEQRLISLNLGNCGLTELPNELFELTWLEDLSISSEFNSYDLDTNSWKAPISLSNGRNNNIKTISPQIQLLQNLKSLSLGGHAGNKWDLSRLDTLATLINLETLRISHTKVKDLNPLKDLKNLSVLHIGDTDVHYIRSLKCLDLKAIFAWRTNIKDISQFEVFPNLQVLSISFLQVSDLKPLQNLIKLKSLFINSTRTTDLSPLEHLINLQQLDISSTKITDLRPIKKLIEKLPINFERFNGDRAIFIKDCNFNNPPKEIVQQGSEAILNYWNQLEKQGGIEGNEAKLIIVGEGGTGKTTLFEKLKNANHNPLKTPTSETHGINIFEGLALRDNFRANLWDFGGQELQYMTHQFFLTTRALYVLIMDARAEAANLSYWFKIISLLGRDNENEKVQLLLVFNKRKNSTGTPQYEDLMAYYKNNFDFDFIEVDFAENDNRWIALKQLIETKLLNLSIQLPKQWYLIREALQEEKNKQIPHISIEEFSKICEKYDVKNEVDQLLCSSTLHRLGQLLHFQNDVDLGNRVILSPEWVVNGVYIFLKESVIRESNGRFSK